MKNILILWVNLFILIISDAVAVKLIEVEKTVVKKDGATHAISKYYVVPNDYDPNNTSNSKSTKASERTILRMNHNLNSKSKDSEVNKDQVNKVKVENKKTNENNNQVSQNKEANNHTSEHNVAVNDTEVSFRSEPEDSEINIHAGVYTDDTKESASTEQILEGDGFNGLLVHPLTISINISSNVNVDTNKTSNELQNQTRRIEEEATETFKGNVDGELNDLILKNFGITVLEVATKNIESFWKLVRLYVNRTSNDTELMAKLKRLSLLLSIFTNLYQAAKSQKPCESMIDRIIDILQISIVQKRNTNQLQSEIVSGHNDEDDSHLASNGIINLIELEGQKPTLKLRTINLEPENPELQERLAEDSNKEYKLSNPYSDGRKSNEITGDNHPLPTEFGVTKHWVVAHKWPKSKVPKTRIVEDKSTKSKVTSEQPVTILITSSGNYEDQLPIESRFPDDQLLTVDLKKAEDQPLSAKSGMAEDLSVLGIAKYQPLSVSGMAEGQPWSADSGMAEDRSLSTESGMTEGQPSSTESGLAENQPLSSESGMAEDQPLSTESGMAEDQPLSTESGTAEDHSLSTESRTAEDQPLSMESGTVEDQSLSTESRTAEDQPLSMESGAVEDQPLSMESGAVEDQPLSTESGIAEDQPLSTESGTAEDQPSSTESGLAENQLLSTESGMTEDQPLSTDPDMARDQTLSTDAGIVKDQPLSTESGIAEDHPLSTESGISEVQPLSMDRNMAENHPLTTVSVVAKDHPLTTVSGMAEDRPLTTVSGMAKNQSLTTKSGITEDSPLTTVSGTAENRPLTTVSGKVEVHPLTTASVIAEDHPLTTVSGTAENRPLTTVSGKVEVHPLTTASVIAEDHPLTTVSGKVQVQPLTTASLMAEAQPMRAESKLSEDQPLTLQLRSANDLPLISKSRITDDQPSIIKSRITKPSIVENNSTDILPLTVPDLRTADPRQIEDPLTANLPSHIEAKTTGKLPWHVEDKTTGKLPWHIEDKPSGKLPWHIESKTTDKLPWHIEDKTTSKLPWHIENKTTGKLPWYIEDKKTGKLPRYIEDKTTGKLPWQVEHRTTGKLPWYIKNKTTGKLPWHIENKTTGKLPWQVEHRTTGKLPWYIKNKTTGKLPWHIENKTTGKLPWYIKDEKTGKLPWYIEDKTTGKLPWQVEHRTTGKLPWYIKNKTTGKLPWHIENKTTGKLPWYIEDKKTGKLPWYIEDKTTGKLPWQVEHRTTGKLPWYIENKTTGKLPWHIENKTTGKLPWYIEDKKTGKLPWYIEDKTTGKLPWQVEHRTTGKLPWYIENKTTGKLPWHIENKTTGKLPWYIADKKTGKLPWYIEDKTTGKLPWQVEHRTTGKLPWYIENKTTGKLPWHIENKTTGKLPWYIEDKKTGNLSWHIEDKTVNPSPWTITHKTATVPWITEDRSTKKGPWNVKYNKIGHSPATLYQSSNPDVTTYNLLFNLLSNPEDNYQPKYNDGPEIERKLKPVLELSKFTQINSNDGPETSPRHHKYSSHASAHSEFTTPYKYQNPTVANNGFMYQHPGLLYMVPYHPGNTNSANNYENPNLFDGKNIDQYTVLVSEVPHQSEYTNKPDDYYEPTPESGKKPPQRPGYISHSSAHSEITIPNDYNNPTAAHGAKTPQKPGYISHSSAHSEITIPNVYHDPTAADSGDINQYPDFNAKVPHGSEYTNVPDDYDEPIPVHSGKTPKNPGSISHSSAHSEITIPNDYNNPTAADSQDVNQYPDFNAKVPHGSESTNKPDYYYEPTTESGKKPPQRPGYISHSSAHSEITIPYYYHDPSAADNGDINQYPDFNAKVPHGSEYTYKPDGYDEPAPVHTGKIPQNPDYISHSSAHSEITIPNDYHDPTDADSGDINQYPDFNAKVPHGSEYTNKPDDYYKPTPESGKKPPQLPGYIPHSSAHSEITIPNYYHDPSAADNGDINQYPDFNAKVPHGSEYTNVPDHYDEPTPVHGGKTPQNPGYISHSSAHLVITIPNVYKNTKAAHSGDINQFPDFNAKVPHGSEYTNKPDEYYEPTPESGKKPPQRPGYISHSSAHSEITIPYDYHDPAAADNGDINQYPDFNAKVPHGAEYKNEPDDFDEPAPVHGGKTPQNPGYISHSSAHSEITIPNDYNNPTAADSGDINQYPDFNAKDPHGAEYTNEPDDYYEPTPVHGGKTPQNPGFISHSSAHSEVTIPNVYHDPTDADSGDINEYPDFNAKIPHGSEYTNKPDDYYEPTPESGKKPPQRPGYISHSSAHSEITIPDYYNNPTAADSQDVNQYPDFNAKIPHGSEYTSVTDDYDEPIPIHGGKTPKNPGSISHSSAHSEITIPNDYNNPTAADSQDVNQYPDFNAKVPHGSEYTNKPDDYYEPTSKNGKKPPQRPGYISHSEIIIPNDYNNPTAADSQDVNQYPEFNAKVPHGSEYTNKPDDYYEPIPESGKKPPQRPGYISHSEIIIPNDYNNPTAADSQDVNQYPEFNAKVPHGSEYTNKPDDYYEPTPVNDGKTPKNPGFISHSSAHSEITIPNNYHDPSAVDNGDINQYPDFNAKVPHGSEYTNKPDDYYEPTPESGKKPPQRPGYISHSEIIIPNYYNNPTAADSQDVNQYPEFNAKVPHGSEYTNKPDDYYEPTPVNDGKTPKNPGFISHSSAHSEITIPNDYHDPTATDSQDINQYPDFNAKVPHGSEYTNVPDDYYEPTPVHGGKTPKNPGFISHSSAHSEITIPNDYHDPTATDSQDINQYPDFNAKVPHESEYTYKPDDYDEHTPVHGGKKPQNPGYISHSSAHSEITIPNDYNNPTAADSQDVNQYPDFNAKIPHGSEYTNEPDDYYEPTLVNGGKTPKNPGFISHSSAHSEITIPNDYDDPTATDSQDINQYPDFNAKVPHGSEYTNKPDDYYEPTPESGKKPPHRPGYISHSSAHSKVTIPNDHYNYPTPDKGQNMYTHTDSILNVPHIPAYINKQDDYGKRIPVQVVETVEYPGWKASSHSQYTNPPNDYTGDDEDEGIDTDILNKDIAQGFVDGGHKGPTTQPSFVAFLYSNYPKKLKNLKKVKMPQTYQWFTLYNVLKLHDVVIKAIELSDVNDSNYRALLNLRKIIKLILIVAEQLDNPESRNEWYQKIFLNAEKNRHPLQLYVYKLIRQRWLHELMLILLKNNFDSRILQNPIMFHFLGSWKFPMYVQNFLKAEDDLDAPVADKTLNNLQDSFSTKTFDDLIDAGVLDKKYVTKKVIQSYQVPNDDIVVSIAAVEAEPDARSIVRILKQYLHYKELIKNQETVFMHDNKHGMLKRITLFLEQKGYDPTIISDLIRKLFSTVFLTERKDCQPHHPHFAKNMFDIILPVLRRSGR